MPSDRWSGRDAVPGALQAARVIADDVVAQSARAAEAGGDRQVVSGGELDRFLAADDRHPDRRARLLQRARPQRHILVIPEAAAIRKDVLAPGAGDDVERLFEAGARVGERHVVDLVFARNAAGKARDQPAVRHAVEHRQLFGEAQRLVQRQQVAVDQQFQVFGALRRGRGEQVRRVHQPVGRAVMLVEADAVIAEPVELLPGGEMLGIGARRDLGLEMLLRQRIGQLAADFQMVELLAIGQQVKDKDFHRITSPRAISLGPARCWFNRIDGALGCPQSRQEWPRRHFAASVPVWFAWPSSRLMSGVFRWITGVDDGLRSLPTYSTRKTVTYHG